MINILWIIAGAGTGFYAVDLVTYAVSKAKTHATYKLFGAFVGGLSAYTILFA